jgi:hypothetical protein
MFHRRLSSHLVAFTLSSLLLMAIASTHAATSLTINGVTDRTSYTDSVQFQVVSNVGFTYTVTLNGKPLPAGVTHTVTTMDYYDLAVSRTQTATSDTTNALVRFILLSSNRGSPERGLIQWTPYPPIPSGSEEFGGGLLHVVAPENYPAGLEIPVIAWVDDGPGNARRVNGNVTAAGFTGSPLPLRRGVGHTFLPAASSSGQINYEAQIQSLSTTRLINIDTSTTWSNVSGILPAATEWPANSRIRVTGNITIVAGNTLTIEAGTIVLLDASVNVTNSGRTVINGTTDQPVVFTAATRVAPEQHTGAWGGFLLRGASAELIASGAIFTGAGASASFSFSPGASHRSEQAVFLIHSGARAALTNCYVINNAGQIANGLNSDVTYDHCLLQRAITCGEYEGGTIIVNHSAVIEFPSIDGEVNATIADADYDGIYFTTGTHILQNSLFGFAKDDAIDSGSGGGGTVVVSNCWVESALHEALAWSGENRQTWSYDSVLINCGQGIECGWSTGNNSPLCYGARLLSLGNSIGARYGDNYEGTTGLGLKTGFLTLTNSIVLNNYRDVWGQVWDDTWNYRVNMMDIHDNFLTAPNTNHPNNTVWNPATHADRLVPFMRTPPGAGVGIGFANWNALTLPSLTNGIPIRLSTFTTNFVSFGYEVRTPTTVLASGTVTFAPGETVKRIYAPISEVTPQSLVRVALHDPVGGEFTTGSQILIAPADTNTNVTLLSFNSSWKYLDNGSDQGTAWRAPAFNDSGWSNGLAQLGYGDSPVDETTFLRRTNAAGTTNITFYFRKAIQVATPAQFVALRMRLLRDDAGVVYVNGGEVFRSPNLPAFPTAINYLTRASSTGENTIDSATLSASGLIPGNNVIAVEIHQESITSSDVSFDLELIGNLAPGPPRLNIARFGSEIVLYWADASYRLEASDALGADANWTSVNGAASPVTVTPAAARQFYRLKKP